MLSYIESQVQMIFDFCLVVDLIFSGGNNLYTMIMILVLVLPIPGDDLVLSRWISQVTGEFLI